MKVLAALAFVIPFAASAHDMEHCSIKVKKTSNSDWAEMATISGDAARKAALEAVTTAGAEILKARLDIFNNCLVYSHSFRIPEKSRKVWVHVDAGNGKVLAVD